MPTVAPRRAGAGLARFEDDYGWDVVVPVLLEEVVGCGDAGEAGADDSDVAVCWECGAGLVFVEWMRLGAPVG